jgi:hypothetical protein
MVEESKRILELQITERNARNRKEFLRLKEKVRTNYGPEENEAVHDKIKEELLKNKELMDTNLKQQMKAKQ